MGVLDRNPFGKMQDTPACRHWKPVKLRLTNNLKVADKQTWEKHQKQRHKSGRIQMFQQQQNQNKQQPQYRFIIRKHGRTKL